MTTEQILDEIIRVAEDVGWYVTTSDNKDGSLDVNFNTDTKFGQDLNCWGTLRNGDYKSLAREIWDWYEGYDPDEQALLWAGPDGHGINGAPYSLRDILNDMEDAESRLEELALALARINV